VHSCPQDVGHAAVPLDGQECPSFGEETLGTWINLPSSLAGHPPPLPKSNLFGDRRVSKKARFCLKRTNNCPGREFMAAIAVKMDAWRLLGGFGSAWACLSALKKAYNFDF
jgi:hypothetical protein